MELSQLRHALEQSWSSDTVFGEWDAQNPSAGQCAVTALVVQDYLGGELVRCPLNDGGSHYWNSLPNGEELDCTAGQFTTYCYPLREQRCLREREQILSGYDTESRYRLLSQRVTTILSREKYD